jgi:hypothetical protein
MELAPRNKQLTQYKYMKVRTGFVSNSSSSSFICEICSSTQSGMDMNRSEAGMVECKNGHTFCEYHELTGSEISVEEKRKKLFADVEESSYYKNCPHEKVVELKTISNYTEDEVNTSYKEICSEDGQPIESCPICMFKDLDEERALRYLLRKNDLTEKILLEELKTKFTTYVEFKKFVDGKK